MFIATKRSGAACLVASHSGQHLVDCSCPSEIPQLLLSAVRQIKTKAETHSSSWLLLNLSPCCSGTAGSQVGTAGSQVEPKSEPRAWLNTTTSTLLHLFKNSRVLFLLLLLLSPILLLLHNNNLAGPFLILLLLLLMAAGSEQLAQAVLCLSLLPLLLLLLPQLLQHLWPLLLQCCHKAVVETPPTRQAAQRHTTTPWNSFRSYILTSLACFNLRNSPPTHHNPDKLRIQSSSYNENSTLSIAEQRVHV